MLHCHRVHATDVIMLHIENIYSLSYARKIYFLQEKAYVTLPLECARSGLMPFDVKIKPNRKYSLIII